MAKVQYGHPGFRPRDPRLGRLPHTPTDEDYALRRYLAPGVVPRAFFPQMLPDKIWYLKEDGHTYQGLLPRCVTYSGVQTLNTEPIYHALGSKLADEAYAWCKAKDGAPEQDGTFDRFLAQWMKLNGWAQVYAWTTSLAVARAHVLNKSPGMAGTVWLNNMSKPDPNGWMRVSGGVGGGHEYEIIAWLKDPRWGRFLIHFDEVWIANTWDDGRNNRWGGFNYNGKYYRGCARMKAWQLGGLLRAGGDFMAFVEKV